MARIDTLRLLLAAETPSDLPNLEALITEINRRIDEVPAGTPEHAAVHAKLDELLSARDRVRPTLADFLLARIAEDEATARSATPGAWWTEGDDPTDDEIWGGDEKDDGPFCIAYVRGEWPSRCDARPNMRHIARWDPARVLAECDAKRRIVAVCMGDDPDQGELDPQYADERVPALVLRLLALPYADHPDYREEWRP